MLKHVNKILIICMAIVITLSISVFAISSGDAQHLYSAADGGWSGESESSNYDGDTRDYCITAYDLKIGISEMKTDQWRSNLINKEQGLAKVIQRKANGTFVFTVDVSQVANSPGVYTGWVIAPRIDGGFERDSRKSFKVYVLKDEATVSFNGNVLPSIDKRILDESTYSPVNAVISISEIGTVSKSGYEFKGWYSDAQLSKPFLIPGNDNYQEQPVTSDIVLYPKWEKKAAPAPKNPNKPATPVKKTGAVHNKTGVEGSIFKAATLTLNNSVSKIEEPKAKQNKVDSADVSVTSTKESKGNRISVMEIMILVACFAGAAGLGVSVAMDARVLTWYSKKKAKRKMA